MKKKFVYSRKVSDLEEYVYNARAHSEAHSQPWTCHPRSQRLFNLALCSHTHNPSLSFTHARSSCPSLCVLTCVRHCVC